VMLNITQRDEILHTLLNTNQTKEGRVHELLINSEKPNTPPEFEKNEERFSCLRFSITRTHYPIIEIVLILRQPLRIFCLISWE